MRAFYFLALFFSLAVFNPANAQFLCGDCNSNLQVEVNDIATILRKSSSGGSYLPECDTDGSGFISAVDALILAKHISGIPVQLNCPFSPFSLPAGALPPLPSPSLSRYVNPQRIIRPGQVKINEILVEPNSMYSLPDPRRAIEFANQTTQDKTFDGCRLDELVTGEYHIFGSSVLPARQPVGYRGTASFARSNDPLVNGGIDNVQEPLQITFLPFPSGILEFSCNGVQIDRFAYGPGTFAGTPEIGKSLSRHPSRVSFCNENARYMHPFAQGDRMTFNALNRCY